MAGGRASRRLAAVTPAGQAASAPPAPPARDHAAPARDPSGPTAPDLAASDHAPPDRDAPDPAAPASVAPDHAAPDRDTPAPDAPGCGAATGPAANPFPRSARPPARLLRHARGSAGRWLHLLSMALLVLAGLGLALAGGVAWRLSRGPVELPWLAARIEQAAAARHVRLAVASLAIAWEGFRRGTDQPLVLRLAGVTASAEDGRPIARVAQGELGVSPGALLLGRVLPRHVALDGATIAVVRETDGTVHLPGLRPDADAPAPADDRADLVRLLAQLTRPPQGDAAPFGGLLSQLRDVTLHDVSLDVTDRQVGAAWTVRDVAVALRRLPAGGVSGTAGATLALAQPPSPGEAQAQPGTAAPAAAQARLALEAALDAGGTVLRATLSPVEPAALGRAAPGLRPLLAVAAPVALSGEARVDAALRPVQVALRARVMPGHLHLGRGDVGLASATLAVDGTPAGLRLHDARVELAPPPGAHARPPVLRAEGELHPAPAGYAATLALALDQLSFADLAQLWPEGTGGNARPWIVANIAAGTARDGRLSLGLALPPDLGTATITAMTGRLVGEDVSVGWLRPVPPIEHAGAVLTLASPDALDIAVTGAREAGIRLPAGSVHIAGLQQKDQVLTLDADLAGAVRDVLALLAHPRLHLLSRHPLGFTDPAGSVAAHLAMTIPLETNLDPAQIGLHATAKLSQLHLGDVALGRALDHGELALDVTPEGLSLSGPAALAGLPAQVTYAMDFRDGPPAQVVGRAGMTLDATAAELARAGLDGGGVLDGSLALAGTYVERRDGTATARLRADLARAALQAPSGWRKPAGAPATAELRVQLDHGRLAAVDRLQADGPELRVRSHMDVQDGRAAILRLDTLELGRTRATGEVALPQSPTEPVRVRLAGPMLDLSERFAHRPPPAPAAPAAPAPPPARGRPWTAQARFATVLLGQGHALAPLAATAANDGLVLTHATLQAGEGAAIVHAALAPEPGGRRLSLQAGDAGTLFSGLDVAQDVGGGRLDLAGRYDDASPARPLAATLTMTDFTVTDAPEIGRVLQGATVYGLADLAHGPGLHFDRLVLPFRLEGDLLQVLQARAFSASLGVTAQGTLDVARHEVALEGTVIPAYFFNQLPGRIPLLGRLFSPEKGGGLFATTFSLRGPANDPVVRVNPLATLAPGVLRGLMRVFE